MMVMQKASKMRSASVRCEAGPGLHPNISTPGGGGGGDNSIGIPQVYEMRGEEEGP